MSSISPPRIHLTGTTGKLGSLTLKHLLETVQYPPSSLQCSTSTPKDNLPIKSTVADFLKPETLPAAFSPTAPHILFIVSYPSIAHELRVTAHKNAIDAAVRAGVKWIVYTSLGFPGDSKSAVMQAHIDTEAYLKKTCASAGTQEGGEVQWTIIREGIYSESWELYLGGVAGMPWEDLEKASDGERVIRVSKGSADKGIAWVGRDELGEATARLLADGPGRWASQTLLFSGQDPVSLKGVADLVAETIGWKDGLKVEEVSEEEWIENQVRRKGGDAEQTREFAGKWASTYPAIGKGELAIVDPVLAEILGSRKIRGFAEVLREGLKGRKEGEVERYAK
ncbi:hypothetical protein MMC25_004465 [Agyrium rufum]|nr:hypothetical protein [Agyrium rufum]